MKSFYLVFLISALAVFTACGHKQKENTVCEENRVVKIKADTVRFTKRISELHYSGTIEPQQTIPLSFETIGTIENVFVQEGDMVNKGQILATVSKKDVVSLSIATEAQFLQAKDAYDRLKTVYEKGSLAEIKWVEIETKLKEAESQMQLAKSGIAKCTLRAPTNGMIGKRNVEPGQYSLSLEDPIELVKIETILVKISVAENEISKIKKGQSATFSISALNGKTYCGTVTNVGVVADFISRTYEVKIASKNPDLEIKPGMVCDVYLNTEPGNDCLWVPRNAVSKDNKGMNYVFVVSDDNKSTLIQPVTLGNYHGMGIEIIDGLYPGQLVVVEGKEKLSNNSLISL
jgi:RND family efflux transporter MFP subunit